MSVSILGGLAKGFGVQIPKGSVVRPTSVLLKRKLFDSWQNLTGFVFVDICAGSGSVGLEAISRGATKSIFIEMELSVFKILNHNIMHFEEKFGEIDYQVSRLDYKKWLLRFKKDYLSWDLEVQNSVILFFDPPYEKIEMYDFFKKEVLSLEWFKGHLWIESDIYKGVKEEYFDKFQHLHTKTYAQGSRYISLFSF